MSFFCLFVCFCLKNKSEVYLDLLAGFGNDFKNPRSRRTRLLFPVVAWTRHSVVLSCSCKSLDVLQVISLVTEGSLVFLFLKKMLHRMYGLPRTVR